MMAVLGTGTNSHIDEMVGAIRAAEIAVSEPISKRPAKVLVVDDDPDTCQLLTTILARDDFQVQVAQDGYEGLESARTIRPDLVILDVMMPGIDGFETYRRLREISDTPVLFLSARNDVESVARALESGAADYVDKPFSNGQLVSRVTNLLIAREGQRRTNLSKSNPSQEESDYSRALHLPAFASGASTEPSRAYEFLSEILDLAGGVIGSLLVALVFLPVAALIRRESKGPILFHQVRIGKNGEPFRIFKFRTMKEGTPAYAQKGKESIEDYVTPLGRVLRRTLIDELPQFLNVLRGEMSVVGPRPELPNIVARYALQERERLTVKPGVTGWWQINGMRQPMSAYTHLDVDYVRHRSVRLDLHIIWTTVLLAVRSLLFKDSGESLLSRVRRSSNAAEPLGALETKQNGPIQPPRIRESQVGDYLPSARETGQGD